MAKNSRYCKASGFYRPVNGTPQGFIRVKFFEKGKLRYCVIPTAGDLENLSLVLSAGEYYGQGGCRLPQDELYFAAARSVEKDFDKLVKRFMWRPAGMADVGMVHSSFDHVPRREIYSFGHGGNFNAVLNTGEKCFEPLGEPLRAVQEDNRVRVSVQISSCAVPWDGELLGFFRINQYSPVWTPLRDLSIRIPFHANAGELKLDGLPFDFPTEVRLDGESKWFANDDDELESAARAVVQTLNWGNYHSHVRSVPRPKSLARFPVWFNNFLENDTSYLTGSVREPTSREIREGRVVRDSIDMLFPKEN